MSKIRINELARQLEVPSHVIVEMLPEVGVAEKKTHSSSIDDAVADLVRKRVQGVEEPAAKPEAPAVAVAEPEETETPAPAAVRGPLTVAAKGAPAPATEAPPSMPLRTTTRPNLAGQPAARPVVPPRPDMVARLQQTQTQAPRPGMPTRSSTPVPGQPIYRGPIRPGQPVMRGPGVPGPGTGAPGLRARRNLHPTSPLRAEPVALPTTEQQRRHQAQPGRDRHRDQEQEESRRQLPVTRREQPAEPPPIDRAITISQGITGKELSEKLGIKANLV